MINFPENSIETFAEMLASADSVCLVAHVSPDGDAVGSVMGMRSWCRECGIRADVVLPDAYPAFIGFLDTDREIILHSTDPDRAVRTIEDAGLLVCMDFNSPSRAGALQDAVAGSRARKVLIDHHLYPERERFDLVFSVPEISSTCELAFYILKKAGELTGKTPLFSRTTAEALFVGMTTDTNNFSNSTYPSTLMMASELLSAGVDRDAILDRLYRQFSESRLRLIGEMLHTNMTVTDGTFSYMTLTRETKRRYNFSKGDVEGVVNRPLEIAGVCISALFTEDDEEENVVKVSMRSRGDISVNDICRKYFNGGGHRNAAGGKLFMSMDEVPEYYVRHVRQFLSEKA